jgi:hypothetical protein
MVMMDITLGDLPGVLMKVVCAFCCVIFLFSVPLLYVMGVSTITVLICGGCGLLLGGNSYRNT